MVILRTMIGHHHLSDARTDAIGIGGIIVYAISDDAKAFYHALGFEPSPIEPIRPWSPCPIY